MKKRLRMWEGQPPENASQSLAGWLGHARQADTAGLRRAIEQGCSNSCEKMKR
ncbi:hypothetical protein JW998_10700 [candidate division KSB1 bacterium]|nr:hypothetical protein [candidate division KSB1 bacterium]